MKGCRRESDLVPDLVQLTDPAREREENEMCEAPTMCQALACRRQCFIFFSSHFSFPKPREWHKRFALRGPHKSGTQPRACSQVPVVLSQAGVLNTQVPTLLLLHVLHVERGRAGRQADVPPARRLPHFGS